MILKRGSSNGPLRGPGSNPDTSRELGAEIITEILTDYMGELAMGGYTFNWRREVLLGAVIGYRRLWIQEHQGTGQINRDSRVTCIKRRAQKLTGKSEWFKNKTTKKDPLKLRKPTFKTRIRSKPNSNIPANKESIARA